MKNRILLFLLLSICISLNTGCQIGDSDVSFAKQSLISLARGDSGAEQMIEWEMFRVQDTNVGMLYLMMPNEKEKSDFRKAFISQFSASFQNLGGSVDKITNWRIESKDSARAIVIGDGPRGAIWKVTVSYKDGNRRLSALD